MIRNILIKSIQIYSIVYLLFTLVVASSIDISPSYNYSNYGGVVPISSPFYKTAAASDSFDPGSISRKFQYAKIASTNPMYDDFEGATYSLKDGEKSPNGKWLDKYNGYGSIGVRTESDGNNVLYEYPMAATLPNQTSASLLVSTKNFSNFILELDMRTDKQLRQNSAPNSSETAWVNWRIADDFHAYYFILKTNGIEFGKKDNNCRCEAQVFLFTGPSPTVQLGKWAHIKILSVGSHATIWVDGEKVVDMDDPSYNAAQMSKGLIGLYNEDSEVAFDNIRIKELHATSIS